MSVEPRQALYYHLVADPGVIAAVNGDAERIHQRRAPTGAAKPLIVIWPPQSRVPEMDLAGAAWRRTRIQVTAIADTQADAEKAANAVIAAVEGFSGIMAGELQVILVEVVDDSQAAQEDIDEIHHHVILRITYRG